MVIVATTIKPSALCSTLFPPLRCNIFSRRESARGQNRHVEHPPGASAVPSIAEAFDALSTVAKFTLRRRGRLR
jgi:hypothetical protein